MASLPQFDPVTESDLQGFVDGRLSPERHMEIDAFLARTPEARLRVDAYRDINMSLHGLYSGKPIPEAGESLLDLEQKLGSILIRRRKVRWTLAAAAAFVLSIGIGTMTSYLTRQDPGEPDSIARFTGMAANAHHLYAESEDGAARISAIDDQGAVLFKAMSQYLSGLPKHAPDLSDHGFKLVGGQMNSGSSRPSLHFVYQREGGKLISLHAGYADSQIAIGPVFTSIGVTPAFYWRRGGVAFTLVGHVPQVELLAMAETISRAGEPVSVPEQSPVIKKATAPAVETTTAVPAIEKTAAPAADSAPVPDVTAPIPEVEPAAAQEEPKDT